MGEKNRDERESGQDQQLEMKKTEEGFYSFNLTIIRAAGPAEVAGELWTIAKNLREGGLKHAYGNTKTPCRVEWEIKQEQAAAAPSVRAVASIAPDEAKMVEAEITEKKPLKKDKKQKEMNGATANGGNSAKPSS